VARFPPRGRRVAVTHGAIAPSTAEAETEPPQIDASSSAGAPTGAPPTAATAAADAATAAANATTPPKTKVNKKPAYALVAVGGDATKIIKAKKYKSKQQKEAERKEKLEMDSDFCRMVGFTS
jgi:hypothetical protein